MAIEFVRIEAEDGIVLDGVLHNAGQLANVGAAVLFLHGKGDNFYSAMARYVPESLSAGSLPAVHLAINMRMHDLGFSRFAAAGPPLSHTPPLEATAGGGMWERIAEGIRDVRAAVAWLRDAGIEHVFISGHSSGGFFATQYARTDPAVAGIVAMSPVHTHRMPFPTWFANDAERDETIARARRMVEGGQGHVLLPLPAWYFAIAAASLVERADEPENVWIDWMPEIAMPLLLTYGDREVDDLPIWRAGFERSPSSRKRLAVLPGADHSYMGAEDIVCAAVGDFVGDVLAGGGVW